MAEQTRNDSRTYSSIAIMGLFMAVIFGGTEILAGFGSRLGVWDFRTGLAMLRGAAYAQIAAGVISAIGCALTRPGRKRRGFLLAVIGLLISVIGFGVPWSYRQAARRVPAIHDITTDTDNPPAFAAIVPLRKSASNRTDYGGPEIAAMQHVAYPDIVPVELSLQPDQAFKIALSTARNLGWQIVDANGPEGRIEATDATFFFGFKDDIIIRISASRRGSRVDVRSLSRVGKSDMGTNAKRVRKYLKKIAIYDLKDAVGKRDVP